MNTPSRTPPNTLLIKQSLGLHKRVMDSCEMLDVPENDVFELSSMYLRGFFTDYILFLKRLDQFVTGGENTSTLDSIFETIGSQLTQRDCGYILHWIFDKENPLFIYKPFLRFPGEILDIKLEAIIDYERKLESLRRTHGREQALIKQIWIFSQIRCFEILQSADIDDLGKHLNNRIKKLRFQTQTQVYKRKVFTACKHTYSLLQKS